MTHKYFTCRIGKVAVHEVADANHWKFAGDFLQANPHGSVYRPILIPANRAWMRYTLDSAKRHPRKVRGVPILPEELPKTIKAALLLNPI